MENNMIRQIVKQGMAGVILPHGSVKVLSAYPYHPDVQTLIANRTATGFKQAWLGQMLVRAERNDSILKLAQGASH